MKLIMFEKTRPPEMVWKSAMISACFSIMKGRKMRLSKVLTMSQTAKLVRSFY